MLQLLDEIVIVDADMPLNLLNVFETVNVELTVKFENSFCCPLTTNVPVIEQSVNLLAVALFVVLPLNRQASNVPTLLRVNAVPSCNKQLANLLPVVEYVNTPDDTIFANTHDDTETVNAPHISPDIVDAVVDNDIAPDTTFIFII